MDVVAVVLGAGRGVRLGASLPKAELCLLGRSLMHWSVQALARAPSVQAVLPVVSVVVDGSRVAAELGEGWRGPARLLLPAAGGETRQASLACALSSLAEQVPEASWVLVHDAARCLVEPADAERVLATARETGAALPIVPVEDTIKQVDGNRVAGTLERSRLGRAQTPQAFRLAILREALEKARRDGFEGTDCASLVERLGVEVRTCAGRAENWKLTLPGDLERAEAQLRARGERA